MPTGAGKTRTAQACLQGAQSPLAIVHTAALRDQTARVMGPDVTVLTVQGALRRDSSLMYHDAILEDECHHLQSSWKRVRALYHPAARILGATATPERADGAPLGALYSAMVAPVSYSDLVAAGHLAPCDVVPCVGFDPAAAYLAHGGRLPGILFASTTAECELAVALLAHHGVRGAVVGARSSARTRRAALAAFEAGQLDLLASPIALGEGFDSHRATVCVLGRQCEHVGTYLQLANRVTRPWPGGPGKRALLLDCTGAAQRHGHPLADRRYSLEGRPISRSRPTSRPAPRRSTVRPVARPVPGLLGHLWSGVRWLLTGS